MIKFKQKGDFSKLDNYLKKSIKITEIKNIIPIAEECIRQLIEATPKDSGLTALSWKYEIRQSRNKKVLKFYNTNVINDVNIAFILDIGHSSNNGTWIEGQHYIEPVVRECYNKIVDNTWKELKRL